MDISEVRVKLVNNPKERLKAFCSITLDDDFVIRDLKVIDGANGTFVAMPSRKLADRCPNCGHKNHLRARFCNECGKKLNENRRSRDGRNKLHADIAHPINAACRERIQSIVVDAYQDEMEKSKQPGYQPVNLEDDLDDFEEELSSNEEPAAPAAAPRSATSKPDNQGGYDDLIAELRRDAAHRRGERTSDFTPRADDGQEAGDEEKSETYEPRGSERVGVSEGKPQPTDSGDDFGAGL